jgi:hypothetical protein
MDKVKNQRNSFVADFIAGGAAGFIGKALSSPHERLRLRLGNDPPFWAWLKSNPLQITKEEAYFGFIRGARATLNFGILMAVREKLVRESPHQAPSHFLIGGVSGTLTQMIYYCSKVGYQFAKNTYTKAEDGITKLGTLNGFFIKSSQKFINYACIFGLYEIGRVKLIGNDKSEICALGRWDVPKMFFWTFLIVNPIASLATSPLSYFSLALRQANIKNIGMAESLSKTFRELRIPKYFIQVLLSDFRYSGLGNTLVLVMYDLLFRDPQLRHY